MKAHFRQTRPFSQQNTIINWKILFSHKKCNQARGAQKKIRKMCLTLSGLLHLCLINWMMFFVLYRPIITHPLRNRSSEKHLFEDVNVYSTLLSVFIPFGKQVLVDEKPSDNKINIHKLIGNLYSPCIFVVLWLPHFLMAKKSETNYLSWREFLCAIFSLW